MTKPATPRLHLSPKYAHEQTRLAVYARSDVQAASLINGDIIRLTDLVDRPFAIIIDAESADDEITVAVMNGGEQGSVLPVSIDPTEYVTIYGVEG